MASRVGALISARVNGVVISVLSGVIVVILSLTMLFLFRVTELLNNCDDSHANGHALECLQALFGTRHNGYYSRN